MNILEIQPIDTVPSIIDNKQSSAILLTAALGTSFGVSALFMSTLGKFAAIVLLGIVMLLITRYASKKN